VILEKLKDPYYARLIFGIPALLLLLFAGASYFGLGWQAIAAIIGLYLLAKGFGIEESVSRLVSGFEFSVEKISSVMYILALPLVVIALMSGYQIYAELSGKGILKPLQIAAKSLQAALIPLALVGLLIVIGRIIDLMGQNRNFEITRQGLFLIDIVLLFLILFVATDWIVNETTPEKKSFSEYTSFSDFLITLMGAMVLSYLGLHIMREIRIDIASRMRLENKEVFTEVGAYLGKIVGVDKKNSKIIVQSPLGQKIQLALDSIISLGDRVIVQY